MRNVARVVIVVMGLHFSLVSSLWAFAVGDIMVHSRRGEPFAAEVRLLLRAHERDREVEVALGTQETYRAEGLTRPAVIDALKAAVPSGARDVIRLSSTMPIQESAFDVVLSVRVGQVTIVKYYNVPLPAPAPVSAHAFVPLPTIVPVASVAQAPKVMSVMQPAKALAKPTRQPRRTERYGPVERGDTLYSIAKALHMPNERLWQAVVVLWRANKEQFARGNLHGVQVGTFLEVPPDLVENITVLRLAEAQEIIANQWEEWQTLQRLGPGKPRVIVARDPEVSPPPPSKREPSSTVSVKREAAAPVAEKTVEKPLAPQAVVLPVGKPGTMVSLAELQTVLQGLEERLTQRLTPTGQGQDVKAATTFVSPSELQASINNLEERLTQRMQLMLTQTQGSEPVRVGSRPSPPAPSALTPALAVEAAQPASLLMVPYVLVLTNALLLLLVGALVWLWLRRRERTERMQRV